MIIDLPPIGAGLSTVILGILAIGDTPDSGGVYAALAVAMVTLLTTLLQQRRSMKNRAILATHDDEIDKLRKDLATERGERRAFADDLEHMKKKHADCELTLARMARENYDLLHELHELKHRMDDSDAKDDSD